MWTGGTISRRATWLQLPRFPTPNGNVPAFPQTDFHLWRNGNLHFTLYLKGHGDSHTRKIGEPPTHARSTYEEPPSRRRRLGGTPRPTLRPRNAVGTAFHRRPSPRAAFGNTIAFVTFDELAKSWRKQMTVGELDRLVGEIRQQKASCC